jgi:hypothetical protein
MLGLDNGQHRIELIVKNYDEYGEFIDSYAYVQLDATVCRTIKNCKGTELRATVLFSLKSSICMATAYQPAVAFTVLAYKMQSVPSK